MSEHGVPRLSAVRRQEERVTPLELFFDLVFVLATTQCTALMAEHPTWSGLGEGLLVLAMLWWSWVGYAWLTSVVDPEEGGVRLTIFVAIAAFLVAALCVPEAFGDLGLTFAVAYGVVRVAHIFLFRAASRDDPGLRRSVTGLAMSSALGVGLLVGASYLDGWPQAGLWLAALLVDMGGPFLFGADGWKLVPSHFAERHGLIIIIALGESMIALGVGAEHGIDAAVLTAAVLGVAVASALWWAYFDVIALVAAYILNLAQPGREQNELARDAYSYLHFPMVAGIVLVALGLEETLAHVDEPLGRVPATALAGGVALYLAAHVAFRYRVMRSFNAERLATAVLLLAVIPLAGEIDALATLAIVAAVLCLLIIYETVRFAADRDAIRHGLANDSP